MCIQLKLNVLFILVMYCWDGQGHALSLQDDNFGSSDEQIERRLVASRLGFSNMTADICTDFYAHVCGALDESRNSVPNVLSKESWFKILNARLEALISADATDDDEPAIRKVKRQYKLCMDYEERNHEGSSALKFLMQKDYDCPMIMGLRAWNSRTMRILEPQKYDPSLFSIRGRNNKIYIGKYDVSVYGRFLSNRKNVSVISHPSTYKFKIKTVFEHMGLINETTEYVFDQALDHLMKFRHDLHSIAGMKTMGYILITVKELERFVSIRHIDWPKLDWESFLRDVFINATGVQIDANTKVYVEMEYMTALSALMVRYGPSCIANHIKLHFLETYLSETSRPLMRYSKDLATAAHDTVEQDFQKSFSNPCIGHPHILRALNYMYLKKWFPKEFRNTGMFMVKRIKEALQDYAKATKMIPLDVIQRIEDRIHRVIVIIGSEQKYSNYDLLDPLYRYEVPEDHLSSVLNARRYFKEYEYSTLNKSSHAVLKRLDILEDELYVSAENGVIYFPIGYMHRASLSPTLPHGKSYAVLGYKISLSLNEVIITQGFSSRKFSREVTWYEANRSDFWKRMRCFENQYHLPFLDRHTTNDEEFKKNYDASLGRFVCENAAFQILDPAFKSARRNDKIVNANELSVKYLEQEFMKNWASVSRF